MTKKSLINKTAENKKRNRGLTKLPVQRQCSGSAEDSINKDLGDIYLIFLV